MGKTPYLTKSRPSFQPLFCFLFTCDLSGYSDGTNYGSLPSGGITRIVNSRLVYR